MDMAGNIRNSKIKKTLATTTTVNKNTINEKNDMNLLPMTKLKRILWNKEFTKVFNTSNLRIINNGNGKKPKPAGAN